MRVMSHPVFIVRMVGVGGREEVELDVLPLTNEDALLKFRACAGMLLSATQHRDELVERQ